MKRGVGFLFLLITIPLLSLTMASAFDDLGLGSDRVEMNLIISANLTAIPTSSSYYLKEVKYKLSYQPLNTWQQQVNRREITPPPAETGDYLLFAWEDPTTNSLGFKVDSDIIVRNDQIKIRDKVRFPLTGLDPEIEKYTLQTRNINSDDPKIINLASSLAEGKDDLNSVAFSLFEWVVNNIEYKKTPFTETSSQPASWVLENRYGVCDELTSLFMALARSIGIPARYNAGLAYSNFENIDIWQPHGWAELYFPDYGWIPFDATYREFGFVDPTHLILRQGMDSNESTSLVEWSGRNVDLEKGPLNISVKFKDRVGKTSDPVEVGLEIVRPNIGFGSYSLVKSTVKNPNYFYVYTDLTLEGVRGLEIDDGQRRALLLKPFEKKSVFWIIKVDENLDPDLIYRFPIGVVTTRNTTAMSYLMSEHSYPTYTLNGMEALLDELEEEEKYVYSTNISLNCTLNKLEFYTYEEITVSCEIRNLGNSYLKGLNLCLDGSCRALELPISQTALANFTLNPEKIGRFDRSITLKNLLLSKRTEVAYTVMDPPNITIESLEYPSEVVFSGKYNLTLKLKKNSNSNPYNVSLIVSGSRKSSSFNFGNIEGDKELVLNFEGRSLREGQNSIGIAVGYQDQNSRGYESNTDILVTQKTENIFQKIQLCLDELSYWLAGVLGEI